MRHDSAKRRPGQVLVEFALIALVLYLLMGAIIEFGRALHGSQTIQQAADVMARELSRTPLPPATTFEGALNREEVRRRIYDDRLLVIDIDQHPNLDGLFATFPVVNQQLRSVMIVEVVNGRRLLRYPGALVTPGDESALPPLPSGFNDSGLRVAVPLVEGRDAGTGKETTVRWVAVVEEVTPGAFSVTSGLLQSGMVTLRINYPFQAATLSGYTQGAGGPFEPNNPIQAEDSGISESNAPPGGGNPAQPANLDPSNPLNNQPYSGRFGLGRQQAWGQAIGPVRPFRKVLSAQAIYRREVFSGN
jgi:hypothetical protein